MAQNYDVIVAGSGAAAMTAAITAAKSGCKVLLAEKSNYFGGTGATSGGVAWLPNNPRMSERGWPDSREQAFTYFESLVGKDRMRPPLMEAFFANARRMVEFLEANSTMKFEATTYPDYKAHLPGGAPIGRSIQARNYDGAELGLWLGRLQPPMKEMCLLGGMMIDGIDMMHFLQMARSPKSFWYCTKRVAAYAVQRLRLGRGSRLTMGNALMGRLLRSAVDAGVELWSAASVVRLIVEAGRVTGVVIARDGGEMEVTANRGVILGTGGFAHNKELVRQLMPHPEMHQTSCVEGDTGDGLLMGMDVGGHLGGNTWHNYLGTQTTIMRDKSGKVISKAPFLRRDRNKPGFIMVNKFGKRFVNEAWPYNDVAHAMNETEGGAPSWLICDSVRLRKYGLGLVRPGPAWVRPLGSFIGSGHLFEAKTIPELARKIGVDAAGLTESVRNNNDYARTGIDLEFHKGETAYDRWQGDPEVKPNQSLGPIEVGPFYAVTLWPGNLGTFCGLETDARARVLDADAKPVPGLYAVGCDMHPVFTGSYPGGGGSIGPGMTFGFIAARDLAGANDVILHEKQEA